MYTAQEIYNNLTTGKRAETGEIYYYFKDDTPKKIIDKWQEITSDYDDYNFADLDEYYRVLNTLVSLMQDSDNFTEDELYTIEWQDVYNADRLDWLKENLSRAYLYDEIKENGAEGIFELIGDMQDLSRGNFASYLFNNFIKVKEG